MKSIHEKNQNQYPCLMESTKNDVIVLTNNLKYKYIEPTSSNFTTIVSNYFLVNPWFTKEDFLDNNINHQSGIKLRENIEYLKTYKNRLKYIKTY
jgi:hypothetical protein